MSLKVKFSLVFTSVFLLLAVVFLVFPEIDLHVSGWFYNQQQKFYLAENPILLFLHNSITYITSSIVIFLVIAIIYTLKTQRKIVGLNSLRLLYLLVALAIGPGLVVNGIFKEHWGRARPSQVEQFGGSKQFSRAFVIADQCPSNCSFVSGDVSVGFYFLSLALVIPQFSVIITGFSLIFGIVISATRVMQGAHFLSDVIFSACFTFIVTYLLFMLLTKIERTKKI